MANTMTLIATSTVGAGGTSSISFSDIPQTYTDLKILASTRDTRNSPGPGYLQLTFNGSSSDFSYRYFGYYNSGPGDTGGNVAGSGGGGYVSFAAGIDSQMANSFGNNEIYISRYTSNRYKLVGSNGVNENNSSYPVWLNVHSTIWRTTAAITSLSIIPGSGTFMQHTSVSLYGIKNS
jgi:hypothetical protein